MNTPGAPGAPGTPGTDGQSAYTVTTADFVVPVDTVTPVTVPVLSSLWMVIGQVLIAGQGEGTTLANPGPATFKVNAIPSGSAVQLLWLQQVGDVAGGTTISSGAVVSPSAEQPTLPLTTKGDVMVNNGSTDVRLGVGNQGQGLIADPGATDGVAYHGVAQTLVVNTTAVSNSGTSATDLQTYSVPGNTLLNLGDSLEFEMVATLASNANQKTIAVLFGATTMLTTGAVAQNGGTVIIRGRIIRTGAATQRYFIERLFTSSGTLTAVATGTGTAAETLSGAVTLKMVGTSDTASSDVTEVASVVKYRAA